MDGGQIMHRASDPLKPIIDYAGASKPTSLCVYVQRDYVAVHNKLVVWDRDTGTFDCGCCPTANDMQSQCSIGASTSSRVASNIINVRKGLGCKAALKRSYPVVEWYVCRRVQ